MNRIILGRAAWRAGGRSLPETGEILRDVERNHSAPSHAGRHSCPPQLRQALRRPAPASIMHAVPTSRPPRDADPRRLAYDREPFPWRFAIYAAVIVYLFVDLYWLHGPLRRRLFRTPAAAAGEPVAAIVYGNPITVRRLDAALDDFLFRHGLSPDAMTGDFGLGTRLRVLDSLIESELVRLYARDHATAPTDEAIHREIARFTAAAGRPPDPADRAAIESRLREIAWIEDRIAPALATTEAEVDAWLAAHPEALAPPDSFRVRHLFLADPSPDGSARRAEIESLAARLADGSSTLPALAAAFSDDPDSRGRDGDAGWFCEAAGPEELIAAVRPLPPGQASAPFLTPAGWHIAQVTERRTGPPPAPDDLRASARRTLRNAKRLEAVAALRRELRRTAGDKVVVFHAALGGR